MTWLVTVTNPADVEAGEPSETVVVETDIPSRSVEVDLHNPSINIEPVPDDTISVDISSSIRDVVVDKATSPIVIQSANGPPGPAGADGAPGPAGPQGPPGSGASIARADTTFTTASLASAAEEDGTVALGKGGVIYTVTVSSDARVRLYSTAAQRTADAARIPGVDPNKNSGLLLDLLLNANTGLLWALSPKAVFENGDSPATTAIYYRVRNQGVASAAITVTITAIPVEA